MKLTRKLQIALTVVGVSLFLSLSLLLIVKQTLLKTHEASKTQARESYGKLPLSFEANHGQTESPVRFISRGKGYSLFLTPTEAVFSLSKPAAPKNHNVYTDPGEAQTSAQSSTVLQMKLVEANLVPWVEGLDELPGKINYFIGNDPKQWRTNIPTYTKIKYHNVYPGVDLVYYGNQKQLEYDFIVAPGASPQTITLDFRGIEKLEIDDQGDLVLYTSDGKIRQQKPISYQEIDGAKKEVVGHYVIRDNNQIGFAIENYDVNKPLVIDPVLEYSTYLGADSNGTVGFGITVDSNNYTYIAGYTSAPGFPIVSGAFDTTYNNNTDAFITKLDPTGTTLIYSTFIGGNDFDAVHGIFNDSRIAVDSTGNLYASVNTSSADFPTTPGAFDSTNVNGNRDAAVIKLDPTGSVLVYSTYLGGNNLDIPTSLALNSGGNAYVTGFTFSSDFPTTPGVVQYGGGAFVTELNTTGTALVFSTYVPGGSRAWGIALDSSDNVYITGDDSSNNQKVFVTKLNPTASAVGYSVNIDGSGSEISSSIAVDSSGSAYITGSTSSSDFPTTAGAYDTTLNGLGDAFIVKLDPNGTSFLYSTLIGGSGYDEGTSIAIDTSGNAYIAGTTRGAGFPTTPDAFQTGYCDLEDGFVIKLNPAGSALVYSTHIGGELSDQPLCIALDSSNNAYITGITSSASFPTTLGAFDTSFNGFSDGFVAKINDQPAPPQPNRPPSLSAPTDHALFEGSSEVITITAQGCDCNNDPLIWSWDLDNNGSFETLGKSISFTAVGLDGPDNYPITVRVTDNINPPVTSQTTVRIISEPPDATFAKTSGPVNEDTTATFTFSNQSDPSNADNAAGFLYSYDCTNDGNFEIVDSPVTSYSGCKYPTPGNFRARGRIKDKDGAFRDITTPTFNVANIPNQVLYSVTDLQTPDGLLVSNGNPDAVNINNRGQIVGFLQNSSLAYMWSNGQATSLGQFSPNGINSLGQVVGGADNGAVLWSNGVISQLGTLGGSFSVAMAINDSGKIVGISTLAGDSYERAFLWDNGVMTALGTLGGSVSNGTGINNLGLVVGLANLANDEISHPFLWNGGLMTDLGSLSGLGGTARAINNSGQVVGSSDLNDNLIHGFIWQSGVMTDLGELTTLTETHAMDINNFGEVVGQAVVPSGSGLHAFIWKNGVMKDLNDFIPDNSGWQLYMASSINDSGQIVGHGIKSGVERIFLLTPLSATPTGSNITAQTNLVDVTFTNITTTGTTTIAPILPAAAGTLPGGYEIINASAAYEITTTANYTAPITVCFKTPSITDQAVFDSLRVLHNESGALVDRTILPPDSPAPDFPAKTLCARVNSLSPFVIAKLTGSPVTAHNFYLHGTGPNNNPSTLFPDAAVPTAATAKYIDSASVNFHGGNSWKVIGTWVAVPALVNNSLVSLADLHTWLGLKNSDDIGTKFDLRVEAYKNGNLISSGETYCIADIVRNANLAKEVTSSFSPFAPVSFNGTTDQLSIKVLTRIGTNGAGGFCGGHSNATGLRLYFDAVSRSSKFGATF